MIEYKVGVILEEEAEALVNTVNCVGVMGRGIALQFKKAWPVNFKAYAAACARKEVESGRMFVHRTGRMAFPWFIINFPTKRHWRGKSRIGDIEAGLGDLVRVVRELGIGSIALPPLGAGLGGLEWADVRKLIEDALSPLKEVRVIVFEPFFEPSEGPGIKNAKIPEMTESRALLVELMHRYLKAPIDPVISLLEVHKLLYFLQEAGQPLQLRFTKAKYGPYAENLRHMLHPIEGHYVTGYGAGGDDPSKLLDVVPGAVEDARAFLVDNEDARARLERVEQLVFGFESSFGLELLTTVHWLLTHESVPVDQLPDEVHAWHHRKRQFSIQQVKLAAKVLEEGGWITSEA